jgi:hypothetical protein
MLPVEGRSTVGGPRAGSRLRYQDVGSAWSPKLGHRWLVRPEDEHSAVKTVSLYFSLNSCSALFHDCGWASLATIFVSTSTDVKR